MANRNSPNRRRCVEIIVGAFTLLCLSAGSLSADAQQDSNVKQVLARQKGDVLKVYLRGRTGLYVNGKRISMTELSEVIKQSKFKSATISAESNVPKTRVNAVQGAIQKAGVKDVKLTAPPQPGGRKETVLKILHRQKKKGDNLGVYLRDARRVYVNGTQISLGILTDVVKQSGVKQATITSESFVSMRRVIQVKEVIQKAGVKKIKLAVRKPVVQTQDDKIGEILRRQKGKTLKVDLKNSRAVYINGKSINLPELSAIVRKSKLKQVTIIVEQIVSEKRIEKIKGVIQKAGVKGVQVTVTWAGPTN